MLRPYKGTVEEKREPFAKTLRISKRPFEAPFAAQGKQGKPHSTRTCSEFPSVGTMTRTLLFLLCGAEKMPGFPVESPGTPRLFGAFSFLGTDRLGSPQSAAL